MDRRELWGYLVWGAVGVAIAVPEISAAAFNDRVPWPTISGMVGHLEYRWSWVALIVVGLIVFVMFYTVRYPPSEADQVAVQTRDAALARTPRGRLTKAHPTRTAEELKVSPYWFGLAIAVVAGGSYLGARINPHNEFIIGYVLYGLIATIGIVIPSAMAFWFAKDVPFPTLFRTLSNLGKRSHVATALIVTSLVILLIHLAFYPWPGIFDQLQQPPTVHSP
jgi:hypothetical protein